MMIRKITVLIAFAFLGTILCGGSRAEDKDRSVPEGGALPSATEKYSTEAPKTGLAAKSAKVGVVARGGWALQFTPGMTCAVFEYANKVYPPYQIDYLGSSGSGVNEFLYYKVQGWKITMAIRNQAIDGVHNMYLRINDTGDYFFYANGIAYPAAN